MNDIEQHNLEKRFLEYLQAFENLNRDNLSSDLIPRFSATAEFKDPFNHVFNSADISTIFEHMFNQVQQPKFEVLNKSFQFPIGMAYWKFSFKTSAKDNESKEIIGMSRIELNEYGQVIKHIDYWDSSEYVYEKVPLLGTLIRLVKKRLSANDSK
jgi:hypothetical protein